MIHDLETFSDAEQHHPLPVVTGNFELASTQVPALIERAGARATRRFVEFFAVTIRNRNTRAAYAQAIGQFCDWCDARGMSLVQITPIAVATYVEMLGQRASIPTVKQHLAAIRMCFDWLVTGHVLELNPAWSVRGPRYSVRKGKTPVLTAAEARQLLDSIDVSTVIGLRDRAIIGAMIYSFARVSAVVGMNVDDYYTVGKRTWIRLREKGGKHHEVPAHHKAVEYLDEYLAMMSVGSDGKRPLFLSASGLKTVLHEAEAEHPRSAGSRLSRVDVLRVVKRWALAAGLDPTHVCCHTFRATGITAYLENGGTLERAQAIAAHQSPRTTKLYDRTADTITLDEIEKVAI